MTITLQGNTHGGAVFANGHIQYDGTWVADAEL